MAIYDNSDIIARSRANETASMTGSGTVNVVATAALTTAESVMDSTGQPFSPDACTHVYARNSFGRPLTDTATDGASTWVKTYSYDASNNLTGKTRWVKQ